MAGTVGRAEGEIFVVVTKNPEEEYCNKETHVKKDLKKTDLKPGNKVLVIAQEE